LVELPTDFGDADSDWETVRDLYQSWESFSSTLNFAWEDQYNVHEDAPNRRIRRLMEDDNKKQRKAAKKEYNNDILQLVAFIKRRDPRVKAKTEEREKEKREQAAKEKQELVERKKEQQKAKEAWRENAQRELEQAEEEDRLAGRIRLADLEDDYDYGGGKKKKGKKKKNNHVDITEDNGDEGDNDGTNNRLEVKGEDEDTGNVAWEGAETTSSIPDNNDASASDAMADDEEDSYVSSSEADEEEPDVWRCECCRKDFKSEGQMVNHMKSKKHKEAFKKYQAKLKKKEEEILAEMMDDLET
jgi:DnaJ family protein A protein 5